MTEIHVIVEQAPEGGCFARAVSADISHLAGSAAIGAARRS